MRVLTLPELLRLTRIELCDLAARITNALPDYPEASDAYANARLNLRNIRRVLARTASLDEAAQVLGIDAATLWRRRKKYGI